ncbi:PorP/SprF family type IX secretion system membrane protein [Hymenobacter weizhouensis]|uniref:PorP/SprF family type IX secretion system membrane protein n=1 Tax=Hymenobacter sp. YIM 151500-1 TaxID=2987689 RepID=UPI002227EBD5|nr:PorP/SprF family type IX secretion system membrane protein [Hymenobacter sp. YIM 151500-1]UYZ62369.1 PorP/SprF family type IX secretion system membrane protein [Hymenobacter sp. YIM 151500-1]
MLQCQLRRPSRQGLLATVLLAAGAGLAQGQDLYFAQPYATRLYTNPGYTGLLDDYSVTLNYRNQFPTLAGTFQTSQLSADFRFRDQRNAVGVLLNHDRTGGIGYTRLQAGATYAHHLRLSKTFGLSAGASVGYGNQRVSYGNLVFGDQLTDDGSTGAPTLEVADFKPVHYLTVGVGGLVYNEYFWVGMAAHHLNQPDLAFITQATLPMRLNVHGGFKYYLKRTVVRRQPREISVAPTGSYTRQGGSQRAEAGLYFTASPLTLGAVYRGIPLQSGPRPQQALTTILGVSLGTFRLGYSYDVSLSQFSRELGGAHELSLTLRDFDMLEASWRRLKRRNYPSIPCPAF